MTGQSLDQETLDDIINRIVGVAQPEKIILFGSAARGEMGPHSDLDFLIIKGGMDSQGLLRRIYSKLLRAAVAVDAIVFSPEDVERYKYSHALFIKPTLWEGKVAYEAPDCFPSRRSAGATEPRQEQSRSDKVSKVQHHWLNVDVMTRPMRIQEERADCEVSKE